MAFYYWFQYPLVEKGGSKGFSNECVNLKASKIHNNMYMLFHKNNGF